MHLTINSHLSINSSSFESNLSVGEGGAIYVEDYGLIGMSYTSFSVRIIFIIHTIINDMICTNIYLFTFAT